MNTLEFLGNLYIDKNIDIKTNNNYYINTNKVLSSNILGPSIVNSSLTSLGVLSSLNISGQSTINNLIANNIKVSNINSRIVLGSSIFATSPFTTKINIHVGIFMLYCTSSTSTLIYIIDSFTNKYKLISNNSNWITITINNNILTITTIITDAQFYLYRYL